MKRYSETVVAVQVQGEMFSLFEAFGSSAFYLDRDGWKLKQDDSLVVDGFWVVQHMDGQLSVMGDRMFRGRYI